MKVPSSTLRAQKQERRDRAGIQASVLLSVPELCVNVAFIQKLHPSPCLSGCLQDLASSSNYLGRGVLESCIIDGLCFYSGSPVNIYEEWGGGKKRRGGGEGEEGSCSSAESLFS